MSSPGLQWYWHRLRAMSAVEIAGHVRKKCFQWADAARERDWTGLPLRSSGVFPHLPPRDQAPPELRAALERDANQILRGHWRSFGRHELQVDDPPRWQCDYLAGKDLETDRSAFELDHRALPDGADIRLIWELNRWHQITRLAQAAYVLGDERAARKAVAWLEDWVKHNPPYRGWNWSSALESGIRLIQFTWIDALLSSGALPDGAANEPRDRSRRREQAQTSTESEPPHVGCYSFERGSLSHEILPPHAWFTWRHKSFGSSANNHLLGELAGLIVATSRWPVLAKWGAPLDELQRRWEHEVLAQFAEDGGHREQALHYHLFSWELCWQAQSALQAARREVSGRVEERLQRAARFYWEVQARHEPWDYGDSDDGLALPLCRSEQTTLHEWREWVNDAKTSSGFSYWLGAPPKLNPLLGSGDVPRATSASGWFLYLPSGIGLAELGFWFLRWDVSPLGYLKTAAHGHLDALHLSVWYKGVALVIDPGTGCYYADAPLRTWLASRAAHNGPCPAEEEFPRRLGPFLWASHHAPPKLSLQPVDDDGGRSVRGEVSLPSGVLRRTLSRVRDGDGWQVADEFVPKPGGAREFTVRWQFAPGTWIKRTGERRFVLKRAEIAIAVELDEAWAEVVLVESQEPARPEVPSSEEARFAGVVSPGFRKTEWAPFLKLVARPGDKPCVFRTTFLASARE